MAGYDITPIEASHKTPNTRQPDGPLGWSFSVVSGPVDGGSPFKLLVERLTTTLPTSRLTFPWVDGSENYFEALIVWEGGEVVLWAEILEAFLYVWSLERETLERLRSECLRVVPELL